MSEVERLRALARKRRSDVGDKISRNNRKGVKLAGTEYDPRRDASVIKRYNKPQLQRYIAEMDAFMSRRVQFQAGNRGAPLLQGDVSALKRENRRFKARGERQMERIGGVMVTPIGVTVSEFYEDRTANRRARSVNTPYGSYVKDISGVTSQKALNELIDHVKKMNSREFIKDKLNQGRDNVKTALSKMGRDDDVKIIDSLTDYQFDVLWFGSPFAEIVFSKYDIEQERLAGTRKERWQDKVVSDSAALIPEFLEWASSEVPQRYTAKKSNKKKR